jgi:hypothetical protein
MGKYNFSQKFYNTFSASEETFEIEGCNSFDEAIKYVEKGVHDRKLQIQEYLRKQPGGSQLSARGPFPTGTPVTPKTLEEVKVPEIPGNPAPGQQNS